jgi:carboxypeptidase D
MRHQIILTVKAPVFAATRYFNNILNLNKTFMDEMDAKNTACGYEDYLNTHTTAFPPLGPIPAGPDTTEGCDMWDNIYQAVYYVNPCFNIYHLTDFCPFLSDELGFPSLGGGPKNYFNRSDVQAAIHAPPTNYYICNRTSNIFPNGDSSVATSKGPLPSLIERLNNTIIANGLLDFLIFANGTLIAIQNMTWNGAQGFQNAPSTEQNFFVPYHESIGEILEYANNGDPYAPPQYDTAGGGFQGISHTERGLTYVTVNLAGHEIPQYTPGAAYRQLEFLLGRIDNLEQRGDYTTQTGNFAGNSTLLRRA